MRHTVLLFALPDEARPLVRRLPRETRSGAPPQTVNPNRLYMSDHLTVAWSGMGERCARTLAATLLDPARAEATLLDPARAEATQLLICGFAGGLSVEAVPGVLLAADRVQNLAGDCLSPDPRLLSVAGSVRLPGVESHRGTLLTVDRVQTLTSEKRDLASRTGAFALDMETFHAAQVAHQTGIPWMAVRGVTDGVDEDLPFDFNTLTGREGLVSPTRVALAALAHPAAIPALIRLGARSAHAADQLALFLEAMLAPSLVEKKNPTSFS